MPKVGEKGPANLQAWKDTLTDEQKREIYRKAGKASREAARKRKQLKDYLQACLELKTETGNIATDIAISLVNKALDGDVQAWNTLRDTIGEKPKEQVELETQGSINITIGDEDEE